jgi:signal transduction histidine kinase
MMRGLFSIGFWWLLACTVAQAQVVLRDGETQPLMGGEWLVMEDAGGGLDMAAVLTPEIQQRFARPSMTVPAYGYTPSAYWARVSVLRDATESAAWYLEFSVPIMQFIDVYVVREGQVVQHAAGGSGVPFVRRLVALPTPVFPLRLPQGEPVELYVRVAGESSKTLMMRFLDEDALRNVMTERLAGLWAYIGLMVGLTLFNALLYLRFRERVFLWYWLYMLSLTVLAMILTGLAQQYLWPEAAPSSLRLLLISICVTVQLGALFFMEFMQTKTTFRLAHVTTVCWLFLLGALMPLSFWLPFDTANSLVLLVVAMICLVGVVFACVLAHRGHPSARHYLISWLPLMIGVVAYIASALGWIPAHPLTQNGIFAGSAFQAVLLSLALADRMRAMKDEKEAALRQMMQQEKMASLGMLSAGVAHEINNPNHFIRVGIGNLSAKVDDLKTFIEESLDEDAGEVRDLFREKFASIESQAEIVREGTQRIDTIVRGMRSGSRADSDQAALFSPVAGLRATVELVQPTWKTVARVDTSGLQAEGDVKGFASQLNQVFTNLLVNACHAIEDRQRLQPGQERGVVSLGSRLDGDELVISIADNGCGMSEAVQQRLFQPFFTTKSDERGTGLGMGICKKIVEAHGGRIEVQSREGAGTTMRIVLPVTRSV